MSYEKTVRTVRETLCEAFAEVEPWFDREEALRQYVPVSEIWSIDVVLEHITLTNHFLMLTLRKWIGIVEQRAWRGESLPKGESDLERLREVGERGTLGWVRPDLLEPTGEPTREEVRATMHRQLGECLILLERIRGGVGALGRIRMTVQDLGKLDLYEWLYFLALHARRHVRQMEAIEAEYRENINNPSKQG